MKQRCRRTAWLIAFLMTAVLYAFIALKMDVRFAMNDDAIIQRALMGYETGRPAAFHLYTHGLLVWPMFVLYSLFPLLPWYAITQLALMFLALTVIAKSLMQVFVRYEKPMWAGAVLAAAFFVAFGLEYVTQFTFTYTAALLGAAAAAQVMSIDYAHASDRQIVCGMLGAAGLVSLCYAIRLDAPLPAIAYCGLAFLFVFWEHFGPGKKTRRNPRPMLVSLLLIAVVLGGMVGVRQIEMAVNASPEYTQWHNERSEALDYRGLSNVPQEALGAAGWDETTLRLAQNWCFLDGDISTEALQTINDALEERDTRTVDDHLNDIKRIIRGRVTKSAYAFKIMAMAAIAGLAAFIGALFMKGRRLQLLLSLVCTAGGLLLMIVYLALQGRLPLRAVSAAAMPAIVMTLCLLPACLPRTRISRLFLYAVTAAVLIHTLASVAPLYRLLQRYPWTEAPGKAYAELESYAVQHPDCLYIVDTEIATTDTNPFPSYPDGLPMNISYWGGWDMRSPASEALFERFGLDVWDFGAESFLREDVFLATTQADPPQFLTDWICAETDRDITWDVIAHESGIYILHFRENGGST